MGDYKFLSFVTFERNGEQEKERDHQRSFRAETPLITNTRAPPRHDPPTIILTLPSQTHANPVPHIKLTPTSPLSKHAALCQQLLVSSKQRNQKCEGFLRHGQGLLIPSHWLFLSFFLLPSYVLKKEKELQFFPPCVLA